MGIVQLKQYNSDTDRQSVVRFLNLYVATRVIEDGTAFEDIISILDAPPRGKERFLTLLTNQAGDIVCLATLSVIKTSDNMDGFLRFYFVTNDVEPQDMVSKITTWAETVMKEFTINRKLPFQIRTNVLSENSTRIDYLKAQGYIKTRYFFNMEYSPRVQSTVNLPKGFRLMEVNVLTDGDKWVSLFNETFQDTWNYHPMDIAEFKNVLQQPNYNSELDLVVMSPEDNFVSFCYSELQAKAGPPEGRINLFGTKKEYRGLGIGRAILTESINRLETMGAQKVRLRVDGTSPTGAGAVYKSVGFNEVSCVITLTKKFIEGSD